MLGGKKWFTYIGSRLKGISSSTFESVLAGFKTRPKTGMIMRVTAPSPIAMITSSATPVAIPIRYGRTNASSRFNCGESNAKAVCSLAKNPLLRYAPAEGRVKFGRNAALAVLLFDVAVKHFRCVLLFLQALLDLFGQHHRTMLAARAPKRDGKVALSFLDVV